MSWTSYVQVMEQGGSGTTKGAHCKYVAIVGKQGGIWGESATKTIFPAREQEMMVGVRAAVPGDSSLFASGLVIGDCKFTCVRNDEGTLVFKGKDDKKKEYVLVIVPTTQAAIVAFHDGEGSVKAADLLTCVTPTKQYLMSAGF